MAGTTGEFVFTVRRRGTEGFRHSQLKLAAIWGVEGCEGKPGFGGITGAVS